MLSDGYGIFSSSPLKRLFGNAGSDTVSNLKSIS